MIILDSVFLMPKEFDDEVSKHIIPSRESILMVYFLEGILLHIMVGTINLTNRLQYINVCRYVECLQQVKGGMKQHNQSSVL